MKSPIALLFLFLFLTSMTGQGELLRPGDSSFGVQYGSTGATSRGAGSVRSFGFSSSINRAVDVDLVGAKAERSSGLSFGFALSSYLFNDKRISFKPTIGYVTAGSSGLQSGLFLEGTLLYNNPGKKSKLVPFFSYGGYLSGGGNSYWEGGLLIKLGGSFGVVGKLAALSVNQGRSQTAFNFGIGFQIVQERLEPVPPAPVD